MLEPWKQVLDLVGWVHLPVPQEWRMGLALLDAQRAAAMLTTCDLSTDLSWPCSGGGVPRHTDWPESPTFAAQFQGTMAQDPQAQANRKRNATRKIARLKAAAAAKQEASKTEKAS